MEVVAAVLIQHSRVLLARRPLAKNHGGLWEFPGGKVNSGESASDALKRELQEELQVLVSKKELEPLTCLKNEALSIEFFPVLMEGSYSPQEHMAVAWMEIDHIKNLNLCPTDKKFVEEFGDVLKEQIQKLQSH